MKMTRAATYATRALCEIATTPGNRPQASHTIARARKIPERFLLKVLKPLADRRILVSMKGPNGGYRLARPAKEISFLEIIEAVDGPLQSRAQPAEGAVNEFLEQRLQAIADTECQAQRQRLSKVTLADLAGGGKRAKTAGKGK
jgi:Rrf2 family transcriptional regulator, cysteine metabolism repressor